MKRTLRVLALGLGLLSTAAGWTAAPVHAEVLFQDLFNDADRDNDGTTDDGNSAPVGTADGIKWLAIGGQTGAGLVRPAMTIAADDDEGGIGGGNALNVATLGANNELIGVFPQRVTLGATVGSQIKVSFDIRVLDSLLPNTAQTFRFGVYQDSDSQFGMASVNGDNTPTVWGQTDGWFDGANSIDNTVGTINDYGVHARVKLGTSASTDADWRILEELNTAPQILGGTGDTDEVARPVDFTAMGAKALNNNDPRHITLTISRVEANESGNAIRHDLDIDGVGFGGHDVNGAGTVNFDSRDTFDYFVGSMTASIGNYRIDNWKLESILGADPGQLGDFDDNGLVDGNDILVWQQDDNPTSAKLDEWKQHFGEGGGGSAPAVAGVPEPSAALLALAAGLSVGVARRWAPCWPLRRRRSAAAAASEQRRGPYLAFQDSRQRLTRGGLMNRLFCKLAVRLGLLIVAVGGLAHSARAIVISAATDASIHYYPQDVLAGGGPATPDRNVASATVDGRIDDRWAISATSAGTGNLVGTAGNVNVDRYAAVHEIAFQLPARPLGNVVDATSSLSVYLVSRMGTPTFNVDAWGLGYRAAAAGFSTSNYQDVDGDNNPGTGGALSTHNPQRREVLFSDTTDLGAALGIASRMKVIDNLLTTSSPLNSYSSGSGAGLATFLNALYDAGAVAGDFAVLRLNADAGLTPTSVNLRYNLGTLETAASAAQAATLTVNFTAVPEASSLLMTGGAAIAGCCAWIGRRRRVGAGG